MAAGTFALTLKSMDYTMLPIPAYVVARIMSRTPAKTLDALISGTIHRWRSMAMLHCTRRNAAMRYRRWSGWPDDVTCNR